MLIWKKALILLILKINWPWSWYIEAFSFHPVSNLTSLSNLIELLVAQRLLKHITANKLQDNFQTAYTKLHSTEIALLKVHIDILAAIDGKRGITLVLLDLSATFDTIGHKTLLSRLSIHFGMRGTVLKWFESYLIGCTRLFWLIALNLIVWMFSLKFYKGPFSALFCLSFTCLP